MEVRVRWSAMLESDEPVKVLIVGAGPTGLAMALSLARLGVRSRVIDQAPAPSVHSKALAIQARTLEVFEALGVVAPMLRAGLALHGLNIYAERRRLARIGLESIPSRYAYILSLEQSQTEALLIAALAAAGVTVERPVELVRFTEDGGVSASLRHPAGREETLRSDWLIGCDGAHSRVRHGLGLRFEGAAYEDEFRLADVTLDGPLAADEAHGFLRPSGALGIIPLPGELHRIIVIQPKARPGAAEHEPSLAFFEEQLREVAPAGTRISDPVWLAGFRVHRRMVDRYRVNRVFLAGDAAHIHSPAGGQGMNTGIQDAFNLAWKLALVVKGAAGEALLDSYQAERHRIGRAVLRGTDVATRSLALRGALVHRLRRLLVPRLLGRAAMQRRLGTGIGGLAIGYRGSPIVAGRAAPAGQRLGDVDLQAPDGSAIRLHQVLDGARHALLLLRAEATAAEVEGRARIAAETARDWGALIACLWIVGPGDGPNPNPGEARVLHDPAGRLRRDLGADLVLVRPDGYVGFCAASPDPAAFRAYLERLFAGPAISDVSKPNPNPYL